MICYLPIHQLDTSFLLNFTEVDDGYILVEDCKFIFPRENIPDYDGEFYSVKSRGLTTSIVVKRGYWSDGSTMSLDLDTRAMFWFCHDACCEITAEKKDHRYRDWLNRLSFPIIRKQGGTWFNAWRTRWAVTKYSKKLKRQNKFVG